MEKGFSPEKKEELPDVKLRVVPPDRDKRFMIGFEGHTQEQVDAYNDAIYFVCKNAGLKPFHQVGHTNDPGYSAWEMWGEADQEMLDDLLPAIEEDAQENFKQNDPDYSF